MKEKKYIKLKCDMYEDTKFKIIDTMEERDTINYIWTRILALCGKINESYGYLLISKNIKYTIEILALEFNRTKEQVNNAVNVFISLNMMSQDENGVFCICNWNKHQCYKKNKEDRNEIEKSEDNNTKDQNELKKDTQNISDLSKEILDIGFNDNEENKDAVIDDKNRNLNTINKETYIDEVKEKYISTKRIDKNRDEIVQDDFRVNLSSCRFNLPLSEGVKAISS